MSRDVMWPEIGCPIHDVVLWFRILFFLAAFAKLRKPTFIFVASVRPSVRMEQLSSHWKDFGENFILESFSKNLCVKLKFRWILTRITWISHEDLCIFMTTNGWILLRIRNFWTEWLRKSKKNLCSITSPPSPPETPAFYGTVWKYLGTAKDAIWFAGQLR